MRRRRRRRVCSFNVTFSASITILLATIVDELDDLSRGRLDRITLLPPSNLKTAHNSIYYVVRSVLVENRPLMKFI